MPGTVKIWWHDGALNDVRRNPTPVVNEPEIGFEQVAVGPSPAETQPAPKDCFLAVVECDTDVRYVVSEPGTPRIADPVSSKPISKTGLLTDYIAVRPNCTISFIEA